MTKNKINIKGLETIFGDDINELIANIESSKEVQQTLAQEIPINKIISNPHQPRKYFNQQELIALAESIKLHGLIQPIIVSRVSNFYQLVAGERRKKASEIIGLSTIKAVIINVSDQQLMEFALIENIQRVDLNIIEEAQAYKTLIDKLNLTHEQLAKKVNKSRPHITNTLRILELPKKILAMVEENKLSMGHIRPLLQLAPNNNLILALAFRASKECWSVRKVEDMVKIQKALKNKKRPTAKNNIYLIDLENQLSKKLNTKVTINRQKVVINYLNDKHLNQLLVLLGLLD